MKIIVYSHLGEKLTEDKFSYLEGGTTNELPSFHIGGRGGDEIHFYCEKKGELDELIDLLKEIKEEVTKE
ncbi:MAG: hypothetical protein AABX44_01930 [Nanoarchaeota archaeon]